MQYLGHQHFRTPQHAVYERGEPNCHLYPLSIRTYADTKEANDLHSLFIQFIFRLVLPSTLATHDDQMIPGARAVRFQLMRQHKTVMQKLVIHTLGHSHYPALLRPETGILAKGG